MQPIRIMAVDDSAVARAVLARILAPCGDLELVAQAAGAREAGRLLDRVAVDIILLDLEMPEMGGLEALPGLLAQAGRARVLVVSSACGAGADATLRALRLGAADTLTKPAGLLFADAFAEQLVERIRRLGRQAEIGVAAVPMAASGPPTPTPTPMPMPVPVTAPEVVGIAASTGGVHALTVLLAALPTSFTAPLLVTQHLPAAFTPYFATQLREASGRPVRVGATGLQPQPGEILLAPGDAHLTLARTGTLTHVRLEDGRSPSGYLPSADPMLASLARVHGRGAAGVILSGMGRDGAEGAAAVVEAGGQVLAQDEASSVVWGMPGTVTRRGLARAVLPPAAIAAALAGTPTEAPRSWN